MKHAHVRILFRRLKFNLVLFIYLTQFFIAQHKLYFVL